MKVQSRENEIYVSASAVVSNTGLLKTVDLIGRENLDQDYLKEIADTLIPAPVICFQFSLKAPLFAHNHLLVSGSKRINGLYQPTMICPQLAPEGKHLLIAGAAPVSSNRRINSEKELNLCLNDLRNLFPDFDKKTEILLSGIYQDTWPGMHAWPGRDMPLKTPIINLYNVGDGVKAPGYTGLPGVIHSGIHVSEQIKKRINLLKYNENGGGQNI